MEFVYYMDGNEIVAFMRDPETGFVKDLVKLSRKWIEELARNAAEKFGLDYDTAFGIAVYLAYVKTVWM